MAVYLAEGVNIKAVEKFVRHCTENNVNFRALQIIKGGRPLVRVALEPYGFDEPCYLYSLSKSFTSVACGICIDEGLLSVDTKMCELFADKMPEILTDELRALTLGHCLSMQNGHGECAMVYMRTAEDSLKCFFEQKMQYTPGTTFCYDTGSTCVCAAAVERVTGKKLVDFLYEKMFSKMDIEIPRWDTCLDGQTFGGTGLYLSNNSLVKFGIMLMNKGVYNGQRIVSEAYLAEASKAQASTAGNGADDWTSGYGYQFWRNGRCGYRGDGAFGQYCLVLDEEDIVVALTAESADSVLELNCVYELLNNIYGDDGDLEALQTLTENVYKPAPVNDGFMNDITFDIAENRSDIRQIRFFGEKLLHIEFQTDYGKKEIVCGNGEYILNHVLLKNLCVGLDARDERKDTIERVNLFASYETKGNGIIEVTLRHYDKPHNQHWHIDLNSGKIDIKLLVGTIQTTELTLINSVE